MHSEKCLTWIEDNYTLSYFGLFVVPNVIASYILSRPDASQLTALLYLLYYIWISSGLFRVYLDNKTPWRTVGAVVIVFGWVYNAVVLSLVIMAITGTFPV